MVTAAVAASGCATFLEDPFLVSPQRGTGLPTSSESTAIEPTAGTSGSAEGSSNATAGGGSNGTTSSSSAAPIAEDTVDFAEPDGGLGAAGAASTSSSGGASGSSEGGSGGSPVTDMAGAGGESNAGGAGGCNVEDWPQGDCTEVQLQLSVVDDSGDWGAAADIDALVDGNTTGAVWATSNEAWVELDLGSSALITRLTVQSGGASGLTIQLLYFDGDDFVEASDEITAGDTGTTEISIDPVEADRVRVVFSGDSSGSGSFGGGFQGGTGGGGAPIVVQEIQLFGVVES